MNSGKTLLYATLSDAQSSTPSTHTSMKENIGTFKPTHKEYTVRGTDERLLLLNKFDT